MTINVDNLIKVSKEKFIEALKFELDDYDLAAIDHSNCTMIIYRHPLEECEEALGCLINHEYFVRESGLRVLL